MFIELYNQCNDKISTNYDNLFSTDEQQSNDENKTINSELLSEFADFLENDQSQR